MQLNGKVCATRNLTKCDVVRICDLCGANRAGAVITEKPRDGDVLQSGGVSSNEVCHGDNEKTCCRVCSTGVVQPVHHKKIVMPVWIESEWVDVEFDTGAALKLKHRTYCLGGCRSPTHDSVVPYRVVACWVVTSLRRGKST